MSRRNARTGRRVLGAAALALLVLAGTPLLAEDAAPSPLTAAAARKRARLVRLESALEALRKKRNRLLRQEKEESRVQQVWENGRGGADLGVRGRIQKLRAERDALKRKAAQAQKALQDLTAKVEDKTFEVSSTDNLLTASRKDLQRQARELATRLQGTLLGMEHPHLVERARTLADSGDEETAEALNRTMEGIQALYLEVLDELSRVGVFEMEIAEAGAGGAVARRKVLRIGDMTGFFSSPHGGGFVLRKTGAAANEGSAFVGEARGLSQDQREAINRFVNAPEKPHVVPYDVTDGRGIAVARSSRTFEEWFQSGGAFMYPLAALVAVLVLVVAWRGAALLWRWASMDRNCRRVLNLVQGGREAEGRTLATGLSGPEGKLLSVGFLHKDADRETLEDAFNEALLLTQPAFKRGLSLIALGAAIAPMIGLLGTVTGMISTFKALVVFGASDPANLAGGISEALITTQAGLLVAVPALLMRGLLGALSDSALSKLEGRAMSLVLALRGAPKPPSPPPPADREPVEDGARPLPGAQAPEPPASEAPEPKAVLEGNADWEK